MRRAIEPTYEMHRVTPLHPIYIPGSADYSHHTVNDARAEIRTEAADEVAAAKTACGGRHPRRRVFSITARLSSDEKTRFEALARHFGLSQSTLASRGIRILLDGDKPWSRQQPQIDREHTAASDRLTIRLRPGDGIEVIRRATERGMKPATYVSALVRAHISANAPLPTAEMNALKICLGVLSNLETVLANTSRHGFPSGPAGEVYREAIRRTRDEIAALGRHVVDFGRAALLAWETHL